MKTGTLKELNVKAGDVVEWETKHYEVMPTSSVNPKGNFDLWAQRVDAWGWIRDSVVVTIISRADDTPTLWRDMTPEEKGALLLAHYEGKVIEYLFAPNDWQPVSSVSPRWRKTNAYRIKPQPKVETVSYLMHCDGVLPFIAREMSNPTHSITFNTIDSKPDPASIKMEEL